MSQKSIRQLWSILAALTLLLLVNSVTHAEPFKVKNGVYIGGFFPYTSISGDFDGDSALVGPDVVLIPKLDEGFGYGITLGARYEGFAIELSYQRTEHDARFDILESDAVLHAINLDLKGYFFRQHRLQPHLLLGLTFPWLKVDSFSIDANENVGDAKFRGIGGNFGGGLSFYPHRRIGIDFTAGYRLSVFTSSEGAAGQRGELGDDLGSSGYFARLGVTFTF